MIEEKTQSAINPDIDTYPQNMNPFPRCLIFHVPHQKCESGGEEWWQEHRHRYAMELKAFSRFGLVCIENLPRLPGYHVPLLDPLDLHDFAKTNGLYVNVDSTHYAQNGVDVLQALDVLKDRAKCCHVSDFRDGEAHLFPGEGDLDLRAFMSRATEANLSSIVLECIVDESRRMPKTEIIGRLQAARQHLEQRLRQ